MFLVELPVPADTAYWHAKTVVLPTYHVTNVPHSFLAKEYYYPGRVLWPESSMVLVDTVTKNATKLTNAMVIDSGYKIPGAPRGAGD